MTACHHGVDNWEFPRGNNQNRVTCSGATRYDELELARASCLVTDPFILVVLDIRGRSGCFQTDSFDVIKCI